MQLLNVDVIDHDEHLWVLNKPSGLLSAPGRGPDKQDCLSSRVQLADPNARLVHRLDQATSGLMVMARNAEVHRLLNAAFAQRKVGKTYLAVVDGLMAMDLPWSPIDAPIDLHWPDRPRHHVSPSGKPSMTWWRPLSADASTRRTLVVLKPLTGRSHQLRLHMHWIGHPILGDTLYAPPALAAASPRLLLHAWHLTLQHPVSGDNRAWSAPVPPEMLTDFCQQTVVQGLHNALTTPTQETFYA
jgi:tRNA pseudouridine32 synthase/23S rRNA pseudouridine746 synthase